MSLWEDRRKEDEEIADMINGVLPEEREQALKDFYGRDKSGFEWLDFGENKHSNETLSYGSYGNYKMTSEDKKIWHRVLCFCLYVFYLCCYQYWLSFFKINSKRRDYRCSTRSRNV